MDNKPSLEWWPAWVIVLDVIGTVLVGLGIYAQVASGTLILADVVDPRAIAVPMILIGALLVTPLLFITVSKLRQQK